MRRLEVVWQVELKDFSTVSLFQMLCVVVLTKIDHPHWVLDEISQILELDRMFL